MSSSPALSLRGVHKAYHVYERPQDRLAQMLWRGRRRFYREFWALRDVGFDVGVGESVGVIGRNGAGKSTLLQIVAGTLAPTAGDVRVRGRVAPLLELGSGFDPRFTGRENAILNAALLGVDRAEVLRRFDEIEEFAGLGDFLDQPLATYSSGMAMRLAFSVAIFVDPQILLVDEALAVGDVGFQHRCVARLDALRRRGVTLVLVSHDLMRLKSQCDRLVYLKRGRVEAVGRPEEVAEAYLQDVLAERQRGSGLDVHDRAGLRERGASLGFGTSAGEITSVSLRSRGVETDAVEPGDPLEVHIAGRVESSVRRPDVFFQIRDHRGYVVYGTNSIARGVEAKAEGGTLAVGFAFPCRLAPGQYSVTASLTDRLGARETLLVDKRVGAAPFAVLAPESTACQGVVDLEATCHELPAPARDEA